MLFRSQKIEVAPPPASPKKGGKAAAPAAAPAAETKAAPMPPARTGQARARAPFEVDISAAARSGENVIAVRCDHSRITELSLGGILRPVLLIEKHD